MIHKKRYAAYAGSGAAAGYDADILAWQAAAILAGYTPSVNQLLYLQALVTQLKNVGAWALTDDYAVYAMENQLGALITLKKRTTQTLAHVTTNNPTFTANRGFVGNQDGYINTGWNPGTGVWQYVQNNARYGYWCYNDPGVASTLREMGNDDNNFGEIQYGVGGNIGAGINSAASVGWTPSARTGLIIVERTGASASAAYQNGASVATGTPASIAIANRNFFVLSADSGVGAVAPTNSSMAAAFIGTNLTNAAMYLAEYNAFRSYMTSVGVP